KKKEQEEKRKQRAQAREQRLLAIKQKEEEEAKQKEKLRLRQLGKKQSKQSESVKDNHSPSQKDEEEEDSDVETVRNNTKPMAFTSEASRANAPTIPDEDCVDHEYGELQVHTPPPDIPSTSPHSALLSLLSSSTKSSNLTHSALTMSTVKKSGGRDVSAESVPASPTTFIGSDRSAMAFSGQHDPSSPLSAALSGVLSVLKKDGSKHVRKRQDKSVAEMLDKIYIKMQEEVHQITEEANGEGRKIEEAVVKEIAAFKKAQQLYIASVDRRVKKIQLLNKLAAEKKEHYLRKLSSIKSVHNEQLKQARRKIMEERGKRHRRRKNLADSVRKNMKQLLEALTE
ncbi:hypothetical protein ADUPG1_008589, partial [Aduncisulcus paluster]